MNILILKFSAIGDIIQSVPAIRAVRKHFPSANIDLLVAEGYENILNNCPYVNKIISFKRPFKREYSISDLKYFVSFAKAIRNENYDLIIDLQRVARSYSLQLFALPLPQNLKMFQYFIYEILLPHRLKILNEIKFNDVEKYLSYLKDYNILESNNDKKLELWFSEEELKFACKFLNGYKINPHKDFLIGITPCVKWDSKKWGIKNYAKISNFLIKNYNATILIFGGQDEIHEVEETINIMKNEFTVNKEQNLPFPHHKVINVAGKTPTIIYAGALIKNCKLFISGDTGLLHVADAVGVKTISIWGATKPEVAGPLGNY